MRYKQILKFAPFIFWIILTIIKLIRIVPLLEGEGLVYSIQTILITTPLDLITFFLFYYFIIPNVIKNNRLVVNIGSTILFWISYGFIWGLVYKLVGRTVNFEESVMVYKSSLGHTLLSTLYAIVLRLSVDWFDNFQKQKELKKQNLKTELALLRSQINPHFLFNTLNNINSFSQNDPEKTSFAIIKLSDIMRYMLYEASEEKVLLNKEIEYIYNLIELQKLRYKENDFVSFKVEGDIHSKMIPPMLFLPFIENAFKHGKLSVTNGIEIYIKIEKNEIFFNCSNQIKELNDTEKEQFGGVGIKNIERRLELLFPSHYRMNISEKNNVYLVELKIQLNEY